MKKSCRNCALFIRSPKEKEWGECSWEPKGRVPFWLYISPLDKDTTVQEGTTCKAWKMKGGAK